MVHGGLLLGRGITTDKVNLLDLSTYSGHRFGVSRQHAVLHVQQNTLMIRDLDSSNGTYLNSYRLAAGVDTPLKEGDTLELGKLPLRVTLAARAASA
jgi:pSer/pThr/pTyr-binding forkhead associated (FHA) protein